MKTDIEQLYTYLQQLILNSVADVSATSKYGGTVFTLNPEIKESQFCGVFLYASHVQLSFSRGASLDDPNKILLGQGKYRRHINFKTLDRIDSNYLSWLIIQSATVRGLDK